MGLCETCELRWTCKGFRKILCTVGAIDSYIEDVNAILEADEQHCSVCHGIGIINVNVTLLDGTTKDVIKPCPFCDGKHLSNK